MVGGFREVVTLGKSAVEAFELVYLIFSFGSFRNRDHSQILGQHNNDADDLVAVDVAVGLGVGVGAAGKQAELGAGEVRNGLKVIVPLPVVTTLSPIPPGLPALVGPVGEPQ